MQHMAGEIAQKPIEAWDIREMQKKLIWLNEKNQEGLINDEE